MNIEISYDEGLGVLSIRPEHHPNTSVSLPLSCLKADDAPEAPWVPVTVPQSKWRDVGREVQLAARITKLAADLKATLVMLGDSTDNGLMDYPRYDRLTGGAEPTYTGLCARIRQDLEDLGFDPDL